MNKLNENKICPICRCKLTEKNIARNEKDNSIVLDVYGRAWCKKCTKRHDSIDWDKSAEEKVINMVPHLK